jgi:hypothetical protein
MAIDHGRARSVLRFTISLLVPAIMLGGCLVPTGDFGRPRPSFWTDPGLTTAGLASATVRGERTALTFHFTDDENQLRDRAWRFVMPAHERSWFDRQVQELARTRIIPVSFQSVDISAYFESLRTGPFRSPASRYRRLAEDANADRLLIGPFRGNATRVASADAVRLRTAETSSMIAPPLAAEAHDRVAENVGLTQWVCERLRFRTLSYQHALDNLVVEMPAMEAIHAERALLALKAEADGYQGISPCPQAERNATVLKRLVIKH